MAPDGGGGDGGGGRGGVGGGEGSGDGRGEGGGESSGNGGGRWRWRDPIGGMRGAVRWRPAAGPEVQSAPAYLVIESGP